MSGIELENQNTQQTQFRSRVILGELKHPKVLDMILKTKIVKSEAAAVRLLLIGAGLLFLTSIIILRQTFSNNTEIVPLDMESIRTNSK